MTLLPDLERLLVDAVERHPLGGAGGTVEAPGRQTTGATEASPHGGRARSVAGRGWRRRLRGRPLGLGVLIAAVAVSGGAYASQGLWRPSMGDDRRGHPVASDSPLPPALLAKYAVLRRPQNDDDRGAGSRDALRWQLGGRIIQTAGVRRIGTGYDHTALVVIPFAHKRRSPDAPDETRELCVWQQDPKEAGGMGCSPIATALARGVFVMSIEPKKLSAAERKEHKRRWRKWSKAHPHGGRLPAWFAEDTMGGAAHLVGLVPDGVVTVRVGKGEHVVDAPVRQNTYQATTLERNSAPIVWLDAAGKVVPQPEPPGTPRHP